MNAPSKIIGVALLSTCLLAPTQALAAGGAKSSDGPDAIVDLLIVRPYLLLKTAVGASLFVFASPFAMANDTVEETAKDLVTDSAERLFSPLGHGFGHDDESHD